jgi:hypothetical protein
MTSPESSKPYRSPAEIVAEWCDVEALYERGNEDPPPAVLAGRLERLRAEHAAALRAGVRAERLDGNDS